VSDRIEVPEAWYTEAIAQIRELRAEVERLHAGRLDLLQQIATYRAKNERLRAALLAGRATHGEPCKAGADCQFIRDANAALANHKE